MPRIYIPDLRLWALTVLGFTIEVAGIVLKNDTLGLIGVLIGVGFVTAIAWRAIARVGRRMRNHNF